MHWAEAVISEEPLAGPELVLAEACNLLRRMQLSGQLTPQGADNAFADLLALPLTLYPFRAYADRIWQLRATVTAYDAWYVALAEALGCQLATLDRRLARASGPACEIVVPPDS